MYCSHHLNCLAITLLLRLVGKTHTGIYCLISYPTNFAVVPLRVFRAELSFFLFRRSKEKTEFKVYDFIERDYNWQCQFEIRNNNRSCVPQH